MLLVEDSAADAALIEHLLRNEWPDVRIARVVTLEAFWARAPGAYDVILSDFRMPGYTALDVLRVVAQLGVTTPVVIVTGAVGEEVAVQCMKEGACDYLLKDRLTRLPQSLAHAIAERRLRDEAEAAHAELRHAHEETIRRLALAVDSSSAETGSHIQRMGPLAGRLARRMGLAADDVVLIPLAASMHDVGKINVPDAILAKPGPLTDEEREVMRRHAERGHEILAGSGSALLDLAAEIALTHHEWWDGSGYPRGLRGEEIPLAGRITAVADVFDALTSDRVYRAALTESEALDLLREESGSHFDPEVVDAFLAMVADDALERR